jgi:hypothetical protein
MAPSDLRLLAKQRPEPGPLPTPCWIWTGYIKPEGYGEVHRGGRKMYAHRLSYETFVGPIPEGLQLDHLCRNRACISPLHLEPVTSRENTMRGENWSAKKARQTHCINGHEFTPENTSIRRNGSRRCRACDAIRCRKRYWAKRDVTEVRIAERS